MTGNTGIFTSPFTTSRRNLYRVTLVYVDENKDYIFPEKGHEEWTFKTNKLNTIDFKNSFIVDYISANSTEDAIKNAKLIVEFYEQLRGKCSYYTIAKVEYFDKREAWRRLKSKQYIDDKTEDNNGKLILKTVYNSLEDSSNTFLM